ncbi:MAG: hypothetical protein AAFV90_16235 [Cyanobacteria bacterium J06634_5]
MGTAEMQNFLHQFVLRICQDPVFRRSLRYHPKETLEAAGFPGHLAPEQLPVRHYTVSVFLDAPTLFGFEAVTSAELTAAQIPIELKLALYGAKPLAMVHGQEDWLNTLAAWARANGLVAMLSPDEFEPCEDENKGGYVNQVTQCYPARAGSGRWRRLLVSRSSQHTMLGWLSLLFGWDHLLGRLFGYPACCAKAFDQRWLTACDRYQGDVASLVLQEQSPEAFVGQYGWQANMLGRYFGAEIISHFPCDLNCSATMAVAERLYCTYHHFEPEAASAFQQALVGTYIYSKDQGVFYFPEADLAETDLAETDLAETDLATAESTVEASVSESQRLGHSVVTLAIAGKVPQSTTVETALFKALAAGDRVTCQGGTLWVDGETFEAQMISFTQAHSDSNAYLSASHPTSTDVSLSDLAVALPASKRATSNNFGANNLVVAAT